MRILRWTYSPVAHLTLLSPLPCLSRISPTELNTKRQMGRGHWKLNLPHPQNMLHQVFAATAGKQLLTLTAPPPTTHLQWKNSHPQPRYYSTLGRQHHHLFRPGRPSRTSHTNGQRQKENPSKSRPFLYPHSSSCSPPPLPFPCQPYQLQSVPSYARIVILIGVFFPLLSSVKYRKSADGLTVTAIFDLPRVKKDDMHVSFQGNRFVVSWQTVRITEREEPLDADDLGSGTRILRELERKKYRRTIPLPDGTRVCLTSDRSRLNSCLP